MEEKILVNIEEVKSDCIELLEYYGMKRDDCEILFHSLYMAEVCGVTTHGLDMFFPHLEKVKSTYNNNGNISVLKSTPSFSLVDANNCAGMVSASKCMDIAIEKAAETGMYHVFAKNANTFSAAFVYSLKAVENNMIGIVFSNSPSQMCPVNGKEKLLGSNPFSVAIPGRKEKPVIIDMSMSVVAKSKINTAYKNGEEIPNGWALDENGNPTTSSYEAVKGSVLPMAGAKGYALCMAIDIVAGVLSGASYLDNVGRFYGNDKGSMNVGQVFAAIDPEKFIGESFFDRIDEYINKVRSSRAVDGKIINLPGDRKHNSIDHINKKGLMLSKSFVEQLKKEKDKIYCSQKVKM